MSEIQIIQANALKELARFDSESVDLIIADPPYNLGKDYGNDTDNMSRDEYLDFSRDWLKEAVRVLSEQGSIYVFMGFRHISDIYRILEDEYGMHFVNWICWHYTQGIGKTRGFSPRHDDILLFSKSNKYVFNLDAIRVPQKTYRKINNMRGANPGDVWEFSHIHYCNGNRQLHPTQKPEALIERMVLASSNENDLVIDPFSGSGTTLRVCQQLNRKAIGIEINPNYVELSKARLNKVFSGFDSIDPKMKRVPNDLNDPILREKYLVNHIRWFLKNHPKELKEFWDNVKKKYPQRQRTLFEVSAQQDIFEENTIISSAEM